MDERGIVVVVDDQLTNLAICKEVLSVFVVFTATSGEELLRLLDVITPDLILLDIEMPGMNGYDTIQRIKAKPETAHIPVMFLSARDDIGSEQEGLSMGAVDYVSKPFSAPLLIKRIEMHILLEKRRKELSRYNANLAQMAKQKTLNELQNAMMETVSELLTYRGGTADDGHIGRTQRYWLIEEMQRIYSGQVPAEDVELLILSARLMAFADVYDAVQSERPYERKIVKGDRWDPGLVDLCLSVADKTRETSVKTN